MSTFEHKGYRFEASFERDDDMGPPWEEHDEHVKLERVPRHFERGDKRPCERILITARGDRYIVDMQAAIATAKKDGWGVSDETLAQMTAARRGARPTKNQIAAAAVEQDIEHMLAWLNDDWCWMGVVVKLLDSDGKEVDQASLWGIDGEGPHLEEVKIELAEELIYAAEKRAATKAAEAAERAFWASRDVVTA